MPPSEEPATMPDGERHELTDADATSAPRSGVPRSGDEEPDEVWRAGHERVAKEPGPERADTYGGDQQPEEEPPDRPTHTSGSRRSADPMGVNPTTGSPPPAGGSGDGGTG